MNNNGGTVSDVIIRIKRPEGYEDVAPELVAEDFARTATSAHPPWEWSVVTDMLELN